MRVFILLTVFVSTFAQADKVILGGFSYHYKPDFEMNEAHPAIGFEKDGLELSIFKNSHSNTAFSLAKIERPWQWKSLQFGYRYGLASGYDKIVYELGMAEIDKEVFIETGRQIPCKSVCLETETVKVIKDNSIAGFMPIAQFITTYESKYLTVDLGISTVSTLVFKYNLH